MQSIWILIAATLTVNPYEPKIFYFEIWPYPLHSVCDNNVNGSIMLTYGVFNAKNPQVPNLYASRDFSPPPTSSLNINYQIAAKSRTPPVVIILKSGETIVFTPVATPVGKDINSLGVINLAVGKPLKFVLHSGEVLSIERTDHMDLPSNLPSGVDASHGFDFRILLAKLNGRSMPPNRITRQKPAAEAAAETRPG